MIDFVCPQCGCMGYHAINCPTTRGADTEYTPTVDELLDGYVTMKAPEIPGDRLLASIQALTEAERGLAQVRAEAKAEALREHAKRLRYWTRDESQKRLRFSVDNAVADLEEEAARIDRTPTETTNGDSDE